MAAPYDAYPPGYDVRVLRDGFAVVALHSSGFGGSPIARGFGCLAAAEHWLEEHVAAIADEEREAAENAAECATDDLRRAA